MSFEQVEETTERYDPQGSVVRSEQKQEERQPPSKTVGGIPGQKSTQSQTAAPLPPQPAGQNPVAGAVSAASVPPPADLGNLTKQSLVTNYEVSKDVRHSIQPVGRVARISVAVVIDNHTKMVTGKDGKSQTLSEPRGADEMKKYRDIVAAAVGFNADRGDKISVENISFEGDSDLEKEPTFIERQGPIIVTGLRYIIIPVVFILIYLLFLRPVQKSIFAVWQPADGPKTPQVVKALPQANTARLQTPMTLKQFEAQISGDTSAQDALAGSPEREIMPLPSPSKMEMIRNRVVEHAQRDPETVARLVRIWLSDEKTRT
jgi:flagellar M-ring protein FliF